MARLEARLRRKLGLSDGLIARSENGGVTPLKARRSTLSRSTISTGTSPKSRVKDTVRR